VYSDIPEDLRASIEPIVEDHGYELMNVETVHGSQSVLLRITVDSRAGDGRVPVDALARMSREIETQLDAADAVAGSYRLEVSSPGLDRMLAREKDFAGARGREVKIRTRRPLDGRRRFKGGLVDFRDGVVLLDVDGRETRIGFDDVEKANVVYAFSSEDFHQDATKGRSARAARARRGRSEE